MTSSILKVLCDLTEPYRDLFGDARLFKGFQAAVTGILGSGSTQLRQIARAAPATAAVPHAERRLRRLVHGKNKRSRLTPETLGQKITELGAARLAGLDEVLVVLDGSALRKPHANHLEHLSTVRALNGGLVHGYPTLNAIGLAGELRVLLYHKLYSPLEPGFRSENAEVRRAVEAIVGALRRARVLRIVFVLDRGFDDEGLMRLLLGLGCSFVLRAKHRDRLVRPGFSTRSAPLSGLLEVSPVLTRLELKQPQERRGKVKWVPGATWVRGRPVLIVGARGRGHLEVNALKVEFEASVKGGEGWVLLTNLPVGSALEAARVVRLYLRRWSIEDVFAWTKGCLGWEGVRLAGFRPLRTLVALAWVAASFVFGFGSRLEGKTLERLAHLGGWVPRKDRRPGKKVILRGLARAAVELGWGGGPAPAHPVAASG